MTPSSRAHDGPPATNDRRGVHVEDSGHTILAGLLWTFLGTGARGLVQLLVLAVLARLLTVSDFGVVSLAMVIAGVSAELSYFSIGPAVVQLPDIDAKHMRVAFTLSVLLGMFLLVLMWWTAPLLGGFFRLGSLTPVLRTLAVLFPLQGAFTVAESLLLRHMRFRLLAAIDATTYAVGYGLVGITLAVLGFGLWAMVGAQCAQVAARTLLLFRMQPHPVTPLLDRRALGRLVRFSMGLMLGKIGNYAAVQGDTVIVGRWLGVEALGIYGRAIELMALPAKFVGEVFDKVLFPGMARHQSNSQHLSFAYDRAVSLIAGMVLPISAALLVLAPEIVPVLLGPRWSGVVAPLQIFAAAMIFRTSYKISDATARAVGAVYRRAWRQAVYAFAALAGAWIGSRWGLTGVSMGVAGAIAINYLLMAQLSLSLTGMPWGRFWSAHLPGLTLAAAVAAQLQIVSAALRHWGASPGMVLAASIATTLATLPLLLRRAPELFLGAHGAWVLQTLSSYLWGGHGVGRPQRDSPGSARPWVMSERAVVVEFAGLAGAGKTAIAAAVAQRLRERGLPVEEALAAFATPSAWARVRKVGWTLSGALRSPGYAVRCARAVQASGQCSVADAAKVLHNWLLISFLTARGSRGKIRLFDQGVFQALWSIGYSARNGAMPGLFRRLRIPAPNPDLVVIVEASPATIVRRLTNRPFGGSRLEQPPVGDRDRLVKAVRVWDEVKGLLVRTAAESGRTRVVVVDNEPEGDVDLHALVLADRIQRLAESGRTIAPARPEPQYSGAAQ